MRPIHRHALAAALPLGIFVACSSSTPSTPARSDPGATAGDASMVDGALGPMLCGLAVPDGCPTTAPCSIGGWGCPVPLCEGFSVVTDGAWVYYYSAPDGELAGEVSAADASFVSCPYGFLPPTACTAVLVTPCADAGSLDADAGTPLDASSPLDADAGVPLDAEADGAFDASDDAEQ